MKKSIIALVMGIMILTSCTKSGITIAVETMSIKPEDFAVTALFEIDGAVIYRFTDSGEFHYFLLGNGDMINSRLDRVHSDRAAGRYDDAATKVKAR